MALNEFGKQAVVQLTEMINSRNTKVGVILAAQGDAQGLLEALRSSTDIPEVAQINTKIDKVNDELLKLETQRDELLKPHVEKIKSEAASQQEGLTKEVDELDSTIRTAKSYIKKMFGDEALTDVPDLLGRKNRDGSGAAGSTGQRVRGFDVYVDDVLATQRDAQGVERSNLAAAAKAAGVDTATLQEAFFNAQGTRNSKEYKDRVEFTVNDGEKDHKVVCAKQSAAAVEDADSAGE